MQFEEVGRTTGRSYLATKFPLKDENSVSLEVLMVGRLYNLDSSGIGDGRIPPLLR